MVLSSLFVCSLDFFGSRFHKFGVTDSDLCNRLIGWERIIEQTDLLIKICLNIALCCAEFLIGIDLGNELVIFLGHKALDNAGDASDQCFKLFGRNVLAVGQDDQILDAPRDVDEAVLVELAEVARVEPAVNNRLFGFLGHIVVAEHNDIALHANLALAVIVGVIDLDFDIGESLTDTTRAVVISMGTMMLLLQTTAN